MMQELLQKLENSNLFKDWNDQHKNSYLSHFFCQIDSKLSLKSNWEVGYYDKDSNKITVFVDGEEFTVKSEDDVFKKEDDVVEKLDLGKIKIKFEEATKSCKENMSKLFPEESFGDGFLVLQTIKEQEVWNFSLITKSLKFANVKIDVVSGDVASHETIELVQK